MRFQLSALQFGKELLNVKGEAEQKQFRRDVRLSPHEEASELAVAFEGAKGSLYLNRAIHPQKSTSVGSKVLECCLPVFSGFSTHPDFFVFLRVCGFETLISKRAAEAVLAAVIVRGGNKTSFFL